MRPSRNQRESAWSWQKWSLLCLFAINIADYDIWAQLVHFARPSQVIGKVKSIKHFLHAEILRALAGCAAAAVAVRTPRQAKNSRHTRVARSGYFASKWLFLGVMARRNCFGYLAISGSFWAYRLPLLLQNNWSNVEPVWAKPLSLLSGCAHECLILLLILKLAVRGRPTLLPARRAASLPALIFKHEYFFGYPNAKI